MKEIWVLSVKTSLPDTCFCSADIETTFTAFDSFEKARDAFRKTIHDFAFSQNSMFDGEGNIIYLKRYAERALEQQEEDENYCADFLDKEKWNYVSTSLQKICSGEDVDFKMDFDSYFDGMIAINIQNGDMNIYGDEDGPINGYDPNVSTNIFSMKEEKDYFLYIDDMFGQECSSELYIDLQKVELK